MVTNSGGSKNFIDRLVKIILKKDVKSGGLNLGLEGAERQFISKLTFRIEIILVFIYM